MAEDERQTGERKDLHADRERKAKPPGRRKSRSGRVYSERRKNRSDVGPHPYYKGDKRYPQRGSSDLPSDRELQAKRAGWRRSKSGTWYYEARRNRSDKPGFDSPRPQHRAARHHAAQSRYRASHPAPVAPERASRPRTGRPHAIRRARRGPPSRDFQEAAIRRDLRSHGVDPETVDYKSEIDRTLSLHDNIHHVRRKAGIERKYAGASSYELSQEEERFQEQQRAAKSSEWSKSGMAAQGTVDGKAQPRFATEKKEGKKVAPRKGPGPMERQRRAKQLQRIHGARQQPLHHEDKPEHGHKSHLGYEGVHRETAAKYRVRRR